MKGRKNNFKKITAFILALVMILSVAACGKVEKPVDNDEGFTAVKPSAENSTQKEFNQLMQDIFEFDVTSDIYTLATSVKDISNFNLKEPSDISFDAFDIAYDGDEKEELGSTVQSYYDRLLAIDYDELTEYQQFVYDKMLEDLKLSVMSYELNDLYSPLAVNNGWVSVVQINMYEYIFDDEKDLEDYHKLLKTFPDIMKKIPGYVQMQIDKYNFAPNDYMIDQNIETLKLLQLTENNPFIDGYDSKIDEMNLPEKTANKYKDRNREYVESTLIPAFAELETAYEKFYGSLSEPRGICHAEGGQEYYDYLIKSYGFEKDAQGLFDYLYKKYEIVSKAQYDLMDTNYDDLVDYYYEKYKIDVPKKPIDMMNALVDEFTGEFPSMKNNGYVISYLPKSLEIDGMLAYCVLNRIDEPKAVTRIRVNGAQVGDDQETLFTTLAHEGFPGHMLHSTSYISSIQYPEEAMLNYLGYVEGWARYVDVKAFYKLGVSRGVADFMQTDDDLNYTVCGLFDVAVNGLGYNAEELNNLMIELYDNDDIDAAEEIISQFSADPGLYLPYSAGYWYTNDLLKDYKAYIAESGQSISTAKIYENYMKLGPAPFSVIRKYLLKK